MDTLAIDIETYSDVSLPDCGVHRYAASEQFEILLFAYSLNDEPTRIIDLASGEKIPDKIMEYLTDDSVIKTAYNAAFERNCINRFFGLSLKPEGWRCTLVQASMLSLPLSLEGVGEALNLDKKKMSEGKDLIRYFCMPCKPTKANGGRTRNLPSDAPEKWELFKTYCIRDVDVEKQIRNKLTKFPIPDREQELYCMDQRINDRGIMVDQELIGHAVACDLLYKETVTKKAYEISGLENPNSVSQLKDWLNEKGIEVDSLAKAAVEELVENTQGDVAEMLKLRLAMSKTSVKKYEAMERSVCPDGRVHGLLQFYGANRTGRWAGRLVQVQNLPRNYIPELSLARNLVKQENAAMLELTYGSLPDTISQLIRTAFIPREGYEFVVADFSAIEARVISWLAGEDWRLEVFRTHGKIYEASASSMFNVPIEKSRRISPRVPRWYWSIDPDGRLKDGTYGRRTSGYRTPMENSEQTDSGFLVYRRELCDRDGNTWNNKPDSAWDHVYERCKLFYDQTSFWTMSVLSRSADRRECMGKQEYHIHGHRWNEKMAET